MTGYLIGVDAGNATVKAALFDSAGTTLAVASRSSETLQPPPGCVERSPDGLWQAASGALRDCLATANIDGGDVLAVGTAGHGNGLHLLDVAGRGLIGIQSMDNRAEALAAQIATAHGDEILNRAQSRPWPAMTPVLLRWVAENRPEVMARAHHALLCKDVIAFRMTGRMGSDVLDLAGTGLLALKYDDPLLRLLWNRGAAPDPARLGTKRRSRGPRHARGGGDHRPGAWHSLADMVRALYEGVAFGHRAHFEILDPERCFRTATLSGGAAKSPLWAQIFADALGMTLHLSDCIETDARGAVIGAGLFDSFDAATRTMARHVTKVTPAPVASRAAWAPPQVPASDPHQDTN